MSQYILEFGADSLRIVGDALLALVGGTYRIELGTSDEQGPEFNQPNETVEATLAALENGSIASVVLRPQASPVRYGLLLAPSIFVGDSLMWRGTVEFDDSAWRPYWSQLIAHDELNYACLCLEEGIAPTTSQTTPQTFPWTESRLVVAAVHNVDGSWLIRENPYPQW